MAAGVVPFFSPSLTFRSDPVQRSIQRVFSLPVDGDNNLAWFILTGLIAFTDTAFCTEMQRVHDLHCQTQGDVEGARFTKSIITTTNIRSLRGRKMSHMSSDRRFWLILYRVRDGLAASFSNHPEPLKGQTLGSFLEKWGESGEKKYFLRYPKKKGQPPK